MRATAACLLIPLLFLAAAPSAGCGSEHHRRLHLWYFSHRGRTDVYRNQVLEFRFSVPIDSLTLDRRTIRIGHYDAMGNWVPAVGALIADGERVYFDPTKTQEDYDRGGIGAWPDHPEGFPIDTEFEVIIPSDRTSPVHLENRAGGSLREEYRSTFATTATPNEQAFERPSVVSTDPPDGASCVPGDAPIVVRFTTRPLAASLLPGETFAVSDRLTGEPIAGRIEIRRGDPFVLEFHPASGYGPGPRDVAVTIGPGIRDVAGNAMLSGWRIDFATAGPAGPCRWGRVLETFDDDPFEDETVLPGWVPATWYGLIEWGTPGRLFGTGPTWWVQSFLLRPSWDRPPESSRFPWSTRKPVRWQTLLTPGELGSAKLLHRQYYWLPPGARELPYPAEGVRVRMAHTTVPALGPDLDANYTSEPPVEAGYVDPPWEGSLYFPYNGRDNVILEIEHGAAVRPGRGPEWPGGDTGVPGRTAWREEGREAETSSFAPDIAFEFTTDCSTAQSLFYDTGVASPRYLAPTVRTVPDPLGPNQEVSVLYQGADVAGVPVTDWVADPALLSGHRFIRFRVLFTGEAAVEDIEVPFVFD